MGPDFIRDAIPGAPLALPDAPRVAVIGGGPAGSFFSYFVLEMAQRMGMEMRVDLFEPRDYAKVGPTGCNMCGGIVSESLVQQLATEGIILPDTVVERGIDSYVLHMHEGTVRITTPLNEQRIAAVHRGAGPRGMRDTRWRSFDGYLLGLAVERGATHHRVRVERIGWVDGRPRVEAAGVDAEPYDLVAVATGVNSAFLKTFDQAANGFQPPRTTRTYICEFLLGQNVIDACMGNAMHVFLLDIPRLEFAALIPKGDYATLCLLGENIDAPLIRALVDSPEVRACLPADWTPPADFCHCGPHINVVGAAQPYADRLVFLGDAGVTRLYKDGIGAAYRTAKAAATTVVFHGVGTAEFARYFAPVCRRIARDNAIGKFIFAVTRVQQHAAHQRRGILRMVAGEQRTAARRRRMSGIMWDMFTGSSPYRNVLRRTLSPQFVGGLLWNLLAANVAPRRAAARLATPAHS